MSRAGSNSDRFQWYGCLILINFYPRYVILWEEPQKSKKDWFNVTWLIENSFFNDQLYLINYAWLWFVPVEKNFFRYLRFSPQNHARMVQRDKFQLLQNTYCCLNWASAKLPTQKWPFLKRHLNIFFMKPLRLASRMNNGYKLYWNFKAFHQRDSIRLGPHSVRVSRSSFQVL